MSGIAVVILNYNGQKFLEKFLPSVIQNSPDSRIIVVDNASTDISVQSLRKFESEVEIIQFQKNLGFTGGYNAALKKIDAKYFLLLNSDVEVTPHWIDPLISYLRLHPEYAAVQPKIRDFNKRTHFEYAGAAGGFVDLLGYPYCRGRIFSTVEFDEGQYDYPLDCDWVSGACMLIRAEAFLETGGFDNDFFAHMEEIDLCWRLRANGWKLACIPESVVYHVGGGTLSKTSALKTYLNFRNGLSLLLKNLPFWELIWKLPLRLILDGLAAVKFGFETSWKHFFAILKAHLDFYLRIGKNLRKRSHVHKARGPMIIWQYFVLKRKTFRDV